MRELKSGTVITKPVHKIPISGLLATSAVATLVCILLTISLSNRDPLIGSKDSLQYKLLQVITGVSAIFTFELTGQVLAQQREVKQKEKDFQKESYEPASVMISATNFREMIGTTNLREVIGATNFRETRYQEDAEAFQEEMSIQSGISQSPASETLALRQNNSDGIIQAAQGEILRQARRSFNLYVIGIGVSTLLSVAAGGLALAGRIPEAGATMATGLGLTTYSARINKDAQEKLAELIESLTE